MSLVTRVRCASPCLRRGASTRPPGRAVAAPFHARRQRTARRRRHAALVPQAEPHRHSRWPRPPEDEAQAQRKVRVCRKTSSVIRRTSGGLYGTPWPRRARARLRATERPARVRFHAIRHAAASHEKGALNRDGLSPRRSRLSAALAGSQRAHAIEVDANHPYGPFQPSRQPRAVAARDRAQVAPLRRSALAITAPGGLVTPSNSPSLPHRGGRVQPRGSRPEPTA